MTADELLKHVLNTETVIAPVMRDRGPALLKIDRQEVIEELQNYTGDAGPGPWEIDEANSGLGCLVLKAEQGPPRAGDSEIRLGGERCRCTRADGDTVVFEKLEGS